MAYFACKDIVSCLPQWGQVAVASADILSMKNSPGLHPITKAIFSKVAAVGFLLIDWESAPCVTPNSLAMADRVQPRALITSFMYIYLICDVRCKGTTFLQNNRHI